MKKNNKLTFSVLVPTRNAGALWSQWLNSISEQTLQPDQLLVIDSASSDETSIQARKVGINVYQISPREFNHGGTRNLAVKLIPQTDVLVFMTQDAILADRYSLANLLACFEDPSVAAAYGRQLPHDDANPLAIHARLFNYPAESDIKALYDSPRLGIKTAFMSNSFAAYRYSVFNELGGFPDNTILSEDMYLTAKMILADHKVVYCTDAKVKHSHNYSPWSELQRYFDIGVFHSCEPWIQAQFGGAGGEGFRYIRSELSFLLKNSPLWIPRALLTNVSKLLGYKLGLNFRRLPIWLRPKLSMYKSYWLQ